MDSIETYFQKSFLIENFKKASLFNEFGNEIELQLLLGSINLILNQITHVNHYSQYYKEIKRINDSLWRIFEDRSNKLCECNFLTHQEIIEEISKLEDWFSKIMLKQKIKQQKLFESFMIELDKKGLK
jgi:hypothetical protein